MTTYNTKNPVPSADARDRYDNSQTLDEVVAGQASTARTRLGAEVMTLAGMSYLFNASHELRDQIFNRFISSSGYQYLGDYDDPGELTFTAYNQILRKDGEFWKPKAETDLPFTTTGVWATDEASLVSVGDAALRQELSAPAGAVMVGVVSPDGLPSTVQDIGGALITRSMDVNVPGDFAGPVEAMNWLRGFTIARQAVVTIRLADGVHTLTESLNVNHPQGVQVRLIGNQFDPDLCAINVADGATFDAVVCSGGRTFGFFDGVHITRPNKSEMPINTTGLLAVQNSTIITGSNVKVSKWFYGIAARDASFIYCPNAEVSLSGDVGIWAFCGSTVVCSGSTSNTASAAGQSWGFGFQAEYGSVLVGTGISATGCKIAGIAALSNSTCRLDAAVSSGNLGSGLFARDGGVIEAISATSSGNGRYGQEIIEGLGRIFGNVTSTGNTLEGANQFAYLSVTEGQARITSSSGPLRVDSQADIYFNTPGGLQAAIRNIANAVNRIDIAGSTAGSPPGLIANGSDDNINIRLTPKGTGRIQVTGTTAGTPTVNSYFEVISSDGAVLRIPVQRM